jgi:hypothetical protein
MSARKNGRLGAGRLERALGIAQWESAEHAKSCIFRIAVNRWHNRMSSPTVPSSNGTMLRPSRRLRKFHPKAPIPVELEGG